MKAAMLVLVLLLLPATAKGASMSTLTWSGRTWNIYNSTGLLGQHWTADNVYVGKSGNLNLHMTPDGKSGGVGDRAWFTYGTVTVRYKISKGTGKYAILLFGKARPGGHADEIDFGESKPTDPDRTIVRGTLHYGAANNRVHVDDVVGDFTKYHTAQVVWHKDYLDFRIDGQSRGLITQNVPSDPMHLTIQTESAGSVPAPSGGPSTMIIDWVSVTP